MKKRNLLFLLLTMMFAPMAMFGQGELTGSGAIDNPININSVDDWNIISDNVKNGNSYNGLYFSLNDNIKITKSIGNQPAGKKFGGIFLGNGNTITVNITSNEKYAAPFGSLSNATIQDIVVEGEITSSNKFVAGVAGCAFGECNFINCHVSMVVNSIVNGDGTHGGLLGLLELNGTANFNNCCFDGKLLGSKTINCGGFVGYNKGVINFNNCLFNPSEITLNISVNNDISSTFARLDKNNTAVNNFTNTYYVTTLHKVEGTARVYTNDDDDDYYYDEFAAPDGNTYYYITGDNKWKFFQNNINENKNVSLTEDLTAHASNGALIIAEDDEVIIDLNGHTLTRDENAIVVRKGATLTIVDNSGKKTGDIDGKIYIAEGQLVSDMTFNATVMKNVETWEINGWNTMASPVGEVTFESVSGLLSDVFKHNIYLYDPENLRWQEYRNTDPGVTPFTTFENGRGYLYRTEGAEKTASIEYSGMTNIEDVTYTLSYAEGSVLKTFNLLGNPFPHDIYKGEAFSDENIADKFYMFESDGTWTAKSDSDAIPAGTAFLVQATAEETLTIKNTASASKRGVNNDNIVFTVANNDTKDVAFVEFKEGHGLNKIEHRNETAPMLYVNYNGANFASANVSDDVKVINLNFKAKTTGKYTLKCKANGEFSYLHLTDRMTGEDVDMLLDEEYSFIASSQDKENRFIVRLEYLENAEISENSTFAYQNGDNVIVSGEGMLQVFDMTGRIVNTMNVSGVENINVKAQGVYIFKLNDKTQKIVIK